MEIQLDYVTPDLKKKKNSKWKESGISCFIRNQSRDINQA